MIVFYVCGVLVFAFYISPHSYRDKIFPKRLSLAKRELLSQHIPFYNLLSEQKKIRFESRVIRFVKSKNFESRGAILIDDDKKILIAASAIKITFGLRYYLLSEFDTILLYPQAYYSPFTKTYNLGETNIGMNTIVFSWKAFEEGYADPNDGLNVALHEFAHAIVLQMIINGQKNNIFEKAYRKWLFLISVPGVSAAIKNSGFFRDYAFVNDMEFFAVTMEAFFEQGEEMKARWPEIYNCFVEMLNMEPLAFSVEK